MKVSLDQDQCTGHAQCFAAGPDVYDLDDSGYCVLRVHEVPQALQKQAIAGAQACPEQALTVSD